MHVNSQAFHWTPDVRHEASLNHRHVIHHGMCRASVPACQNKSISVLEQGLTRRLAHNTSI
jgi:hypothetical protein